MSAGNAPLDLLDEDLVRLSTVAARLPWKPRRATVWRWTTAGFDGVQLESIKIGTWVMTSEQAVDRFFARIKLGIAMIPRHGHEFLSI